MVGIRPDRKENFVMTKISNSHEYDDIINMPHHVSTRHPHMAMTERAAQFLPFAALTGYDAVIDETARYTDQKAELTDSERDMMDYQLRQALQKDCEVIITYFCPDEKKDGGAYCSVTGKIVKLDSFSQQIIMENGIRILMDNVMDISLKIDNGEG